MMGDLSSHTRRQDEPSEVRWRLKVREVAEEKGWERGLLAEYSGVPIEVIRQLCEHPTSDTHLSILGKLAKALGVKLTELIDTPDPLEIAEK